jgi:NYN domain
LSASNATLSRQIVVSHPNTALLTLSTLLYNIRTLSPLSLRRRARGRLLAASAFHGAENDCLYRWIQLKGSDVNLATELLVDGFQHAYEVAVVISNDSDLVAPVRAVRTHLGNAVGIINPHLRQSAELRKCASFVKDVRPWALSSSHLPPTLSDAIGEIHKPAGW